MDSNFSVGCFRVGCCNLFSFLPRRLAGINGNIIPDCVNPSGHENIVYLRAITTSDRCGDRSTYFTNERIDIWNPRTQGACVGRKLPG